MILSKSLFVKIAVLLCLLIFVGVLLGFFRTFNVTIVNCSGRTVGAISVGTARNQNANDESGIIPLARLKNVANGTLTGTPIPDASPWYRLYIQVQCATDSKMLSASKGLDSDEVRQYQVGVELGDSTFGPRFKIFPNCEAIREVPRTQLSCENM